LTEYRSKSLRVPRQDAEIQHMLKAQADEYNHGGYTESETESDFETLDNSSANLSESTNQTTAREIAAANRTLAIAKEEGADPGLSRKLKQNLTRPGSRIKPASRISRQLRTVVMHQHHFRRNRPNCKTRSPHVNRRPTTSSMPIDWP
jgi:hypothetical protein